MQYASLDDTWGDLGNLPQKQKKSQGRQNGGSKIEDDFNRERNREMRIQGWQDLSTVGMYQYPYDGYDPQAMHMRQNAYTYNHLHGRHPGSVGYGCHCHGAYPNPPSPDSELQKGTFYLTLGLFLLLLFDIGLKLQSRR
jgi:hypothetical protein